MIGLQAELALLKETDGLEECLAAGVLQEADGGVAFRHELARRAIEEAIDPARRAELHASVLATLQQRPESDSARLAHHAEAAGDGVAVLEHARAAAKHAAERGAHREAAAQYARALRFADGLESAARAELLGHHAYECHLTDQIDDALAAQKQALEHHRAIGDRLKEGEALHWISLLEYLGAEIEESRQTAHEALVVLEQLPPGRELARAYSHMAHQAQLGLDVEETVRWGERALSLAGELGDQETVITTLTTIGIVEATAGRGTAKLERSLALALDDGTDDQVARAYAALVFRTVRSRDWAAADRWLAEAIPYATERDLDHWRTYLLGWRAQASLERGRWDDASADIHASLLNPHAKLSRSWPLLSLAQLRARRGDPDVWAVIDEATALTEGDIGQKRVPIAIVRAEAAFLADDSGRALAECGAVPVSTLTDRWIAGKLAVWRRRAGGQPQETGWLPEPYARELAGDHAGAAAAWKELQCPYEAAMALAGSEDEHDLRRSHEMLLGLGAQPAAAIVARRLRERGARG
ncbi:MAG: helix-turn-helix transcriptional regulator, partial [Gaiellaceae bacterium]